MSNDLTSTPHLWVLTEPGILTEEMVVISKILFIPVAAGNDLIFKQWNESSTVALGTRSNTSATISGVGTITATTTTHLPSAIADGHIFEIYVSGGTSDNYGKKLVETAGDNDDVVIHEDDWTTEGPFNYCWRTFATTSAITMKAGAGDASPIQVDFGPNGRIFPNLTLETISAGTAYVYLRIT